MEGLLSYRSNVLRNIMRKEKDRKKMLISEIFF
ncbi:BnaA02g25470D [Brassica napus]|uniref:BnaA02g25470D protein n=1 Tax=Brassica napus TaxID=3708 RepID=A0A078GUW0_BRANA|nr:BnaA02g25470D [Brassica napus]